MSNNRLIIFAALEMETRAAAKAMGIAFQPNRALVHTSASVQIHTIGMRAQRLPEALLSLELSPADRVWMVGLAGALDPSLRVGDVVIDSLAAFPRLADATIRPGRIHTSDRLVASPAEKNVLFDQTGALAVDMEQRIVREALAPLGVSVTGIRAIGDTAKTSLDPALPSLVNAIGRPRWPSLAFAILRRPGLIVSLLRLGRDSARAAEKLTEALKILRSTFPTRPPSRWV